MDQPSLYKQIKHFIRDKATRRHSVSRLHNYWRAPDDGNNTPEHYIQSGHDRSRFLVDLINQYASDKSFSILEPGCNVGRNLHHLYSAGYRNLAGIEISETALATMGDTYPDMSGDVQLYRGSIESVLPTLADAQFDVIFTMAVLEHLHYQSEWVFEHLVRITAFELITIEDERGVSWRHFPRDYGRIFTAAGMTQLECFDDVPGLSNGFRARVFRKS